MISIFEVKTLLPQGKVKAEHCAHFHGAHSDGVKRVHGVIAEFDTGQALVEAARKTMTQGFTKVEAYTPVPIEELNDIIHKTRTVLPKIVLAAGLAGMATGFALQYLGVGDRYPMNIGGRPLASWTTFIVPSYELTILFAALSAAIGMIVLSGLPQPYHPVFNVDRFSMASSRQVLPRHRSTDPKFGAAALSCAAGAKGVTTLRMIRR